MAPLGNQIPGLSRDGPRTDGSWTDGPRADGPQAALILRSAALFAILYQFRLLAEELSDTPVFIAFLIFAFAAPGVLHRKKIPPVPALIVLILTPWAARSLIAFPRFFFPGPQVTLDSLLLNLDRNTFVSLIPFYWAALTTYFSLKSRTFLRADIIASDVLLVVIFCIAQTKDMEAYHWPVLMIALFGGIILFQFLALMLSIPPEYRARKGEGIQAGFVLSALVFLGALFLIRPSQEGAINRSGGLLEPKLFRFDISQFLRLENEISMRDDLLFILKKDPEDSHILLRRFVLSGYSEKQGFFRHEEIDEKNHPQQLPGGETILEAEPIRNYRITGQEYFLVNFDSAALIAMNEPAVITPFDTWDTSSFNSAYGVQSYTSQASPSELIGAVQGDPGPEILGLSPGEYVFYTNYGGDEEIAAYARDITEGSDTYWAKIYAVYSRLKYGEYRYSLKPGIAPDGNQLKFFLFEAKKGYCSYYAFAMALLLRSMGIPARVAVGFFIDPELNTFNYYPVRSDMAHAWVEVRYPGYGWIEYDPTTSITAEDEEFRPPSGAAQDAFERLLKEILENHTRLRARERSGAGDSPSALAGLGTRMGRFLQKRWILLILLILGLTGLTIRTGPLLRSKLSRSPRKKAIRLWAHVLRRYALGGFTRSPAMTEAEWAQELDRRIAGLYSLYQCAAAARYAPEYGREQFEFMHRQYLSYSLRYGKVLPLRRRLLGWICPPLALVLPKPRFPAGLLLLVLLLSPAGDMAKAQADAPAQEGADTLYRNALNAQDAELWERAIELFSRGSELYPGDIRFPWTLGDLYFSRNLYGLAQEEYRRVDRLVPADSMLLYRLFQTSGYLNENDTSAEYLERLLAISPDNKEAVNHLGWMYYKLHRLGDGERLLLAALDRLGPDAYISTTLGIIYSNMFRYGDAKRWYLDAINRGEDLGDREFVAVAHYNLSILESRFYRFADALDQTNASLRSQNRALGRLALGELFLRRLDISRALGEYQGAYEMDVSSLSKVMLAQLYQIAGQLDEARLYAEDCLSSGDLSWMLNYGIDPVQYKQDLHEILYKTYSGLEKTESFMVYGSLWEKFLGFLRAGAYRFKTAVHRHLFQKYSLLAADAYRAYPLGSGDPHPDGMMRYYNAFKTYPRRALTYLQEAREFETPLIPQSEPSYDLEAGILRKDPALLGKTLLRFDPVWERDMIADVYGELARQGSIEREEAAERLYALNRGGLRQRGISLPAEIRIDASASGLSGSAGRIARTLRRIIAKTGIADPGSPGDSRPRRFRLEVTITESREAGASAACELFDTGRGIRVFQREIPLVSLSPKDLGAFARALGEAAFTGK
jgi:transglutaminase-like putative cysteine protease/Tfp pilus assembly protein PilF